MKDFSKDKNIKEDELRISSLLKRPAIRSITKGLTMCLKSLDSSFMPRITLDPALASMQQNRWFSFCLMCRTTSRLKHKGVRLGFQRPNWD